MVWPPILPLCFINTGLTPHSPEIYTRRHAHSTSLMEADTPKHSVPSLTLSFPSLSFISHCLFLLSFSICLSLFSFSHSLFTYFSLSLSLSLNTCVCVCVYGHVCVCVSVGRMRVWNSGLFFTGVNILQLLPRALWRGPLPALHGSHLSHIRQSRRPHGELALHFLFLPEVCRSDQIRREALHYPHKIGCLNIARKKIE